MSQLQNLRMYFLGRRKENLELILNGLKIGKYCRTDDSFLRGNKRGYVHFIPIKLDGYVVCPLYKVFDTIFPSKYFRMITNPRFYDYDNYNNSHHNNWSKGGYKSWRFVLSSVGLTVALCEGTDFSKGKTHLRILKCV